MPARLGGDFRRLLASSWVAQIGDGIGLAAGPLLVARQTSDAGLVALAATVQWLAPLLFALHAGVLADRLDRRRVTMALDVGRCVVLVLLAFTILGGVVHVWMVLLALFLLASAEVVADTSSSALVPMTVEREDLGVANARMQVGFLTLNQLAGPPLGAALFGLGVAVPVIAQALLVAASVVLLTRVRAGAHAPEPPRGVRREIVEGLRWVRHHAAVRTLVLTILIFNLTFGAAWSVLVLYSRDRLGLGAVGFGLITTVQAAGGLLGTLSYGRLTARYSLGTIMRVGLIIETLTHLVLAVTTSAWVAMPVFFVFGAHAFIWGTTSITVRQRAVPTGLQGRVGSVNRVGSYAGLVIGSAGGAVLAQHLGVTAPFWFAFAGSALFLLLWWGQLRHLAHDDAAAPSAARSR